MGLTKTNRYVQRLNIFKNNCIKVFLFKNSLYICRNKNKIDMKTKLNQQAPIFWKGQLCKFIKWESLTFGGKLKIKINKKFIEADINELSN
jgi:hypothetical protein